jgi:hypothetical protein
VPSFIITGRAGFAKRYDSSECFGLWILQFGILLFYKP